MIDVAQTEINKIKAIGMTQYLKTKSEAKSKAVIKIQYVSVCVIENLGAILGFFMCILTGIFTSFVPCFDFINNYVCKIDYEQKMYFDHFINYFESWKNMGGRLNMKVF